jgi:hypothetical protein
MQFLIQRFVLKINHNHRAEYNKHGLYIYIIYWMTSVSLFHLYDYLAKNFYFSYVIVPLTGPVRFQANLGDSFLRMNLIL